jgi:RNA polymerase sigma-70 factor (ECF subfamily)
MHRSREHQVEAFLQNAGSSSTALEQLMVRYQKADEAATQTLIELLSPQLYRFFAAQLGNPEEASDMLQDAWLRIHRVRHTYRPGEPLLPWVYAIARCVRVDSYRKRRRIASREILVDLLPDRAAAGVEAPVHPPFDQIIAVLPASQREVLTMLKVNGLSLEEVARATSSSLGSVKQKAHRAYERLREVLQDSASNTPDKGAVR